MDALTDVLYRLSERERKLVLLTIAALGLILLIQFVIIPSYNFYHDSKSGLKEMQDLALWMTENAAAFDQMSAANSSTAESGINLLQALNSVATEANIQISRIEPTSDNRVRTTFSEIPFPNLVNFLSQVESKNISIYSLNVDKTTAPGFVNAGVIFEIN